MDDFSIFHGFSYEELADLSECFCMEERNFTKGSVIVKYSADNPETGIIKEGLAYLISINDSGEENILDYYEKGNLFSSRLSPGTDVNLYFVTAKTDCTVRFVNHDRIFAPCRYDTRKHLSWIHHILNSVSCRSQIHVDILSQRTIRGKLMVYFSFLREKYHSSTFVLPVPLSDLAEYICTDRSAMMREIKKMNQEGLIVSKGRSVRLC